jgi:hypothetical protein
MTTVHDASATRRGDRSEESVDVLAGVPLPPLIAA